MPVYRGRREGVWRVVAYGAGKSHERSVHGSREDAEAALAILKRDVAYATEPYAHSLHFGRTHSSEWPTGPGVYFLQIGERGPIKIGVADNIKSRCLSHQSSCPYRLRLILVMPDAGREQERQIHEHFAKWRIRGEWFKPCQYLLDCIEDYKRGPRPEEDQEAAE